MREEYIDGNPLAGFQAARAYIKCPSDDEIRTFLKTMQDRWKPSINPSARFLNAPARLFYSRRNYAIIAGLIETTARISEMLSLTLDDYQPAQRQIVIRRAKGNEPRVIPISGYWADAVDVYLRVRPKVESNLLFINEFGEHICVNYFAGSLRAISTMPASPGLRCTDCVTTPSRSWRRRMSGSPALSPDTETFR